MLVDREEREALAGLIQEFLDERIKAFEFDERLTEFSSSTDPVVRHVAGTCWYFFDDFQDHLITVNKAGWDYLQRLLLLLKSDCVLQHRVWWVWSWTQLPAAAGVVAFAVLAQQAGWGSWLLLISIPFGVLSLVLSHVRPQDEIRSSPLFGIIAPFATFTDLAEVYHRAGFQKSRFPRHLGKRQFRSPSSAALLQLQQIVICLVLGPLLLVFQGMPKRQSWTGARSVN